MDYNILLKTEYLPFSFGIIDQNGIVLFTNVKARETFPDLKPGVNITNMLAVKLENLMAATEGAPYPVISYNDRKYKLVIYYEGEDHSQFNILFTDVTSWEDLKDRYNDEKACLCKLDIDNYDQLIEGNTASPNLELSTGIDKIIRRWALKIDASVTRIKGSHYLIWFEQRHLEKMIEEKFTILDEVRDLETKADFPASLSIGIGAGGKSISQTEAFATAALDLALGRGGDQAVVKRGKKVEYFGGRLQTVEKSNKGKSRIVGHALRQLIDQAQDVFIMGHVNADMDAFGSSIGIYRLCMMAEKEPYIVIDEINDSLSVVYRQFKDSGLYRIIKSDEAVKLADEDSLLIVCDTNIPNLVQCPELLSVCEKIAVIDHHRKSQNFIENPTLGYIESYASSTSELVTEILQYMLSKRDLTKLESEALLAGIIVDTNNFSIKTGVRTFDAAAWLRRQGADPTEVKRFFQESFEGLKLRANAIREVEIINEEIAIARCPEHAEQAQIFCAQIADQLLTLKGIKASFAIGRNTDSLTVISARSLGEINVQLIMEKFGGGGHLTTAAAQVDMDIEEAVEKIRNIMEGK